jgi:photosystem II stability/assembly factor-like uncharacterized protein
MIVMQKNLLAICVISVIGYLAAVPRWTLQTSGTTARFRGVSAVDDRMAWTSGSRSTVLRTLDSGTTWEKVVVTSEKSRLSRHRRIDDRVTYALSIGNGRASRVFKTIDAGQTWSEQFRAEDQKVFLDAMSFWDAQHGLIIGDSIDHGFFILTTENGGATWNRVPTASLPPALENEGAFAASGTNIAVFGKDHAWIGTGAASKARVLFTNDRGRTWKVSETPIAAGSSAGIFSLAFKDAKHGIAVGGDYSKEKDVSDNAAITNDGGLTWQLVRGLSGFRSAVAYVPRLKGAVVAVGPSGSDYSTDDGRTWRILEGPGFDTLSFARKSAIAWGAGARGIIGRLNFSD